MSNRVTKLIELLGQLKDCVSLVLKNLAKRFVEVLPSLVYVFKEKVCGPICSGDFADPLEVSASVTDDCVHPESALETSTSPEEAQEVETGSAE